jgi:multimeric flavodoxin WrbA
VKKRIKPLAIGIAGSARRRGNSTTLLQAYLEGAEKVGFQTKVIHLYDYTFQACRGCDRCVKGKPCLLHDGLEKVFPLMKKAAIWAMASPVYYDGVTGQLKSFFDRLRFTTYDPHKLKGPRRGILIITYEDKKRKDYPRMARSLIKYLSWQDRGDFGRIRVAAADRLGPWNAWKKRPALLKRMKKIGLAQAGELKKLY